MSPRLVVLLFACLLAGVAHAAGTEWKAGEHYFLIEPPQPTDGDTIEVTEVFSYACPACNTFRPIADKIKETLPDGATMDYLPASFRPDEDWPVFQRAFLTARALGLVDKTHNAVFDAIWAGGPLAILDAKTHRPKNPMPTIQDVAEFYAKYGVGADDFVATANSFAINTQMKRADARIKAYGVDSTPSVVINGKYRVTGQSAGGSWDKLQELVLFLVEKEAASGTASDVAAPAAPAAAD
jgi:thiol:disulfide interchange protein DsbA